VVEFEQGEFEHQCRRLLVVTDQMHLNFSRYSDVMLIDATIEHEQAGVGDGGVVGSGPRG